MTALELLETIYSEHDNHVEQMWIMGDCDCNICLTLQTMATYLRKAGEMPKEEDEE